MIENYLEEKAQKILAIYEENFPNTKLDVSKLAYIYNFEIIKFNHDYILGKIKVAKESKEYKIMLNENLSKFESNYLIVYLLSYYFLNFQAEDNIYKIIFSLNDLDCIESYLARAILLPKNKDIDKDTDILPELITRRKSDLEKVRKRIK